MKLKLTIVLLLLMALLGCSDAPELVDSALTELESAAEEAGVTDESAATEAPAAAEAVNETDPSATEGAGATNESAAAESSATSAESAAAVVPLSAVPEAADLQGAPAAIIGDTSGYFRLQTHQGAENGTCLEGNRLADDAFLQGAAFMDACQNVTGQFWKLSPAEPEGYYHLQTLYLEQQNKCLEGNRIAEESVLGGAAFMSDCSNTSGQSWKFVEAGDGAYRLQTAFLEPENNCLEGNQLGEFSLLRGASFMSDCQEVTGQLWTLVPVTDTSAASNREIVDLQLATAATLDFATANVVLPGVTDENTFVYYSLQTSGPDGEPRCLEGNNVADGSLLGGASFADECKNVTGQQWLIIPTSQLGVYSLLPKSHEGTFKCFEGNQVALGAFLDGAAFMDDCAHVTGQQWKFVDAGNGAYRLQTELLAEQNMCLDANLDTGILPIAASMSACDQSPDQLWTLVPVTP